MILHLGTHIYTSVIQNSIKRSEDKTWYCGIEIQKLFGLIYKWITLHEDNKKLPLN